MIDDDFEMIDLYDWQWVFDEASMVCINKDYGVIVDIRKINNDYFGILKYFPFELSNSIYKLDYAKEMIDSIVAHAVKEAKKTFMYKEWLEQTDQPDTKNARGWFNCPGIEKGKFMDEHPGYFETNPETGDIVDP